MRKKTVVAVGVILLLLVLAVAAGMTIIERGGWRGIFKKPAPAAPYVSHPATPPSPQDEKKSPLKKVIGRETAASRARVEASRHQPSSEKRRTARFSHAQQVGENLWAVTAGPFPKVWADSTARALRRARVNVKFFTRQEGGYLVLGAVTERQAQVVVQKIAGKGVARKKIAILPPKEKL